jgi:ribosome-associated translation inhibitor RaiA
MKILINTDNHILGRETMAERFTRDIEKTFAKVDRHVTRIEVHLTDENGAKASKDDKGDKRCTMEARLEGRQPIAVTEHAHTLDLAVHGAARKLEKRIESILGAQRDNKRHAAEPLQPAQE